jgi:ArsR family transcriptional regulator, virulence genes transcriptional regulator
MSSRMPLRNTDADDISKIAASAQRASTLLKALAHETRLLILCLLAERERTVTELEAILGLQQAVVSQHLARLRMERLVDTRRDGRQIWYGLVNAELRAVVFALHDAFCSAKEEKG